ncbi:ArsR/SmtB family transcription factor [Anaerosporobacter faecicola]|uniref:ArsR/SmtB family transcription factor n=1 Tax=Anaerosporobacter faecicola TaxID=2718714 RepID=UPI00143AF05A|nr:metalloregulator ArsR/SmtB family transcription factor [Anaerosporobacter faecicola]
MYELIGPNSYCVYYEELEYIFIALRNLTSFPKKKYLNKIYKNMEQQKIEGKYRPLYEIMQSICEDFCLGFLEFLIEFDMEKFSLDRYEAYLISLPKEEFLTTYFCGIPKEEIVEAIEGEEGKQKFFEKYADTFSQYLSFEMFFDHTQTWIAQFFSYVKSLMNEQTKQCLERKQADVLQQKEMLREKLKEKEPFAYSEELMGKNCYYRGPYQTFYFMPSVYFPGLYVRIFRKDQFLIFDYNGIEEKRANVPEQLKALADQTRYGILLLLKKEEHLTGVEVAKKMKLATSTVSHHMNILRDSGLVHEEPVGSTKYYSISLRSLQNCIKVLQDTFL